MEEQVKPELRFVTKTKLSKKTIKKTQWAYFLRRALFRVYIAACIFCILIGILGILGRRLSLVIIAVIALCVYSLLVFIRVNWDGTIQARRIQETYGTDTLEIKTGFADDGIHIMNEFSNNPRIISYASFASVLNTKGYLYLVTKAKQIVPVNKSDLSEDELKELTAFLQGLGSRMKKAEKITIIISSVILGLGALILILFVWFKIDSAADSKERALDMMTRLMNSISSQNYDEIKSRLRHFDGTDLSDEEISNYLLNTGLYRAALVEDQVFYYDVDINLFNTREGAIQFSFTALDGESISNQLWYEHVGADEYLATDEVQTATKEILKYSIARDLADGTIIEEAEDSVFSEDDDSLKINVCSFITEPNGELSVEVIKEAKRDLEIRLEIEMSEGIDTLKNINENYTMEWDDEYREVSICCEKTDFDRVGMMWLQLGVVYCSMVKQAIDKIPDWRLTIYYYDDITGASLATVTIR